MRLIAPFVILALLISLGVIAQESMLPQDDFPRDVTELSAEEMKSLWKELEKKSTAYARPPLRRKTELDQRDYSGEWIEENGNKICDGYLTRKADEQYCSKEIPNDWLSFEFDGETYYVAPLENGQCPSFERLRLADSSRPPGNTLEGW